MANNILQIKRTSTSGRTPNTTGSYATNSQYIAAGELALNMADGILYSSNGSAPIVIGSNVSSLNVTGSASMNGATHSANVVINNNKYLNFQTVNTSAYVSFVQQNDDNFVMYSTNTAYGTRAIWSVYANSITSNVNFSVRTVHNGGLTIPAGVTLLDSTGTQGTAGQVLTSNGTGNVYWSTASGGGVNTAAQYTWSNTQTFSNNITFSANVIVANVFSVGNSTVNTYANSTHFYSGNSTVYGYGNNTADVLVSASGNLTLTATSIVLANATVNTFVANTTQLTISTPVAANGSVGTAGQALISTGTGVQWGTSSPGYNFSSQFNGSSYFSVPNNAALNFGSGDFTIEGWWYFTDTSNQSLVSKYAGGSSGGYVVQYQAGNLRMVLAISGSDAVYTFAWTPTINTWYHIAITRSGTNGRAFINGTQIGSTTTFTTSNIDSSTTLQIGLTHTTSEYTRGFASNIRIIKGTALYTANFTAPTTPLSAISGTSLLTCNAITPSDTSINSFVVTNAGVGSTATLSPFASTTVSLPTTTLTAVRQQFTGDGSTTTFSIAGGYTPNAISVFVNGVLFRNGTEVTVTSGATIVFAVAPLSGALIDVVGTVGTTYSSITPISYSTSYSGANGQYLSVPANAAFNFGTGDFTIECWSYFNDFSDYRSLMVFYPASGVTAGAGWWSLQHITSTNKMGFYYDDGTGITGTTTLTTNVWYHVAMVRSGGIVTGYVNGQPQGTASYSGTVGRSDSALYIGAAQNISTARMNGYISNARITKGVAVYTGAFTPPQTPLAAVQSATNPSIQAITGTQTSLLTCNGPTIVDGSTYASTITNNGTVPVSTAVVPTFTNVTINNNNIINFADGTTIGTAISLGQRNKIINGAMAIDQRNAGASQTITAGAALAYTVDRWYAYCTGANVTGQRVAGSTASSQYNYQFTGAASVTGIGFGQRIETLNSYDLAGTTATLSVVLSNSLLTTVTWTAYYASTADTFGTLASPTRTQIATGTFTISSTLTRYSTNISIPSAATTGIEVVFSVGAQTSGTWVIGTVQLEAGSVATPFERRLYPSELQMSQRYFESISVKGWWTQASIGSAYILGPAVKYYTPKRISIPSASYSGLTYWNTSGISVNYPNQTTPTYVDIGVDYILYGSSGLTNAIANYGGIVNIIAEL